MNIFTRFVEIAHQFPHKLAIVSGNDTYTYADLLAYSEQLASQLADHIQSHEKVGVLSNRNGTLIAIILAIFRLGACYVPIDPRYPEERIQYITNDAGIKMIVGDAEYQYLTPKTTQFLSFDKLIAESNNILSIQQESLLSIPQNMDLGLAYIIYTSGTTGKPKGVMIPHENVLTLLDSTLNQGIHYSSDDIWTMYHSYAFDFSIWEIFGSLLTGGTLHIISDEMMRDIYQLYRYLNDNHVTVLNLTPSVFKQLLSLIEPDSLTTIRYLIFGGERFDLTDYAKWLALLPRSKANLINMYGITETTVHTTIYQLKPHDHELFGTRSPIGIPLQHFEIHLLDQDKYPVKPGTIGEMYIAGKGLAQGYLNKPEMTTERFLPIPDYIKSDYKIMYKSGDLAQLENGQLFYLGRSDNQVKLRGYRIELDEIEKVVLSFEHIKNAAIIVHDTNGLKVLLCFYQSPIKLEEIILKKHIQAYLPSYMTPDKFIHVINMPVNINGKINKTELMQDYHAKIDQLCNDDIVVDDPEQRKMLHCWKKAFGEDINLNQQSHFFICGGYSLLAFRLLAEINQQFKVNAEILLINNYPVFIDLLTQVKKLPHHEYDTKPSKLNFSSHVVPATYNQLALYYTCASNGSSTYNICFNLEFNPAPDVDNFRQTLTNLVNENNALRTSFFYCNGTLCLKTLPPVSAAYIMEVLYYKQEQKSKLLRELASHEFDLSHYLFQFNLLINEDKISLFINIHHTIFDGTSLNIFLVELLKRLHGELIITDSTSYTEFSLYQKKLLADQHWLTNAKNFWRNNLHNDNVFNLRFIDVQVKNPSLIDNQYAILLTSCLDKKIKQACEKNNISPYIFYLMCYGALISIYTRETKFYVGVPYANRPLQFLNTIGYFINSLPLSFDFSDKNKKIHELINKLNQQHLSCLKYQELPLSLIMEDQSFSGFSAFFAYQRGIMDCARYKSMAVTLEPISNGTAKFDLFLSVNSLDENNTELRIEFNPSLLSLVFIQNFSSHYQYLLELFATCLYEDKHLSWLTILENIKNTSKITLEGEMMPIQPDNIVSLFKQSTKKNNHAIAIIDENLQLTYQQIDKQSDILAKKLMTAYKNAETTCVGLYFRRDITMPLYILAVLKAGLTYIPLNEEFPSNRIKQIKEIANPLLILTNIDDHPEFLQINQFCEQYAESEESFPDEKILGNKLAYIMFTSGTTGIPKGVSLTHRSLTNRIIWMRDQYQLSSDDTMFMKTPFNFDVSFGEIFLPLVSGARLFVSHHQAHQNMNYIIDKLSSLAITHIYFVPTMLTIFLQYINNLREFDKSLFKSLKIIYCSGEALSQSIVNDCYNIFPDIMIYNQYGPTEAGEVSHYLCKEKDAYQIVPIGHPINNTQFLILDNNGHSTLKGMPGELFIAGECLAQGYYNQPLLTEQQFITHTSLNKRLYKTGDLVMLDYNNNLCFLERIDSQAKINGIRVELSEIEQSLLKHEKISQIFVTILKNKDDTDKLIAFYVTKNNKLIETKKIYDFLKEYLPQYMLPNDYFHLEKIPTTINGKIDRNQCLHLYKISEKIENDNVIDLEEFSDKDKNIIMLWCELLNRNLQSVSLDDNFLFTGGSSLLLSKLILELEKRLGFRLNLFDIINQPILKNLLTLYNNQGIIKNDLTDLMLSDIELGVKHSVSNTTATEIKTILLTGANGFVGRNTLDELIRMYPNTKIICLQRNSETSKHKNVSCLIGYLDKPHLGLNDTDYKNLCQEIDVIVHIAAYVNHLFDYEQHRQANVLGTNELIHIALTDKKKKLIFISTTGASLHHIDNVSIDELNKLKIFNGYVKSKIISEKIIYQAVKKHGLSARILRLGYVGPNLKKLDFNPENNHLYALFKSYINKRAAPIWDGQFECLPVNDVAFEIAKAVTDNKKIALITTVANYKTISWRSVYQLVEQIKGLQLNLMESHEWVEKILRTADPEKDTYLYKLIPLYHVPKEKQLQPPPLKDKQAFNGEITCSASYKQIINAYLDIICAGSI